MTVNSRLYSSKSEGSAKPKSSTILIVASLEGLASSQWKLLKRPTPPLLRSTAPNSWGKRSPSRKLAEAELVLQHLASTMVPPNVVPKVTVPMIQGRTILATLGTAETITVVATGIEEIVGDDMMSIEAAEGMTLEVGEMIIEEEVAAAEGEIEENVETAIMIMIEEAEPNVTEVATEPIDFESECKLQLGSTLHEEIFRFVFISFF